MKIRRDQFGILYCIYWYNLGIFKKRIFSFVELQKVGILTAATFHIKANYIMGPFLVSSFG